MTIASRFLPENFRVGDQIYLDTFIKGTQMFNRHTVEHAVMLSLLCLRIATALLSLQTKPRALFDCR
jgi:hypothetical protein